MDVVLELESDVLVDQEGRNLARLQDRGRLVLRQDTFRAGLKELETDAGGVCEDALGGARRNVGVEHESGLQFGLWLKFGRLLRGIRHELDGGLENPLADGEGRDLGRGRVEDGERAHSCLCKCLCTRGYCGVSVRAGPGAAAPRVVVGLESCALARLVCRLEGRNANASSLTVTLKELQDWDRLLARLLPKNLQHHSRCEFTGERTSVAGQL